MDRAAVRGTRWRTRRGVEIPGARNTRITAENAKRTVTYWRSGKWDLDIESVNDDLISENTMYVHLVWSQRKKVALIALIALACAYSFCELLLLEIVCDMYRLYRWEPLIIHLLKFILARRSDTRRLMALVYDVKRYGIRYFYTKVRNSSI